MMLIVSWLSCVSWLGHPGRSLSQRPLTTVNHSPIRYTHNIRSRVRYGLIGPGHRQKMLFTSIRGLISSRKSMSRRFERLLSEGYGMLCMSARWYSCIWI
ncbi:hypothetical protein B0H66DRAFT_549618 [Apodospora peruviana]|uniref:Secreted protein n=1 Tax=Apodospora peruviana TaxID=516989 RepID=A0AAE0IIS9_9PEZI|nr:hypothetical protein B0H66DRAFT_549618 [Apodospora peruviana]